MARIIYALSGQGRGHTSRVSAISEDLRARGHEVVLCCGGTAQEIFSERGERVIPVPALRQIMEGNEVQHADTVRENWRTILQQRAIVDELTERFAHVAPHLLITDFEAFSPRAARHLDVPVVSFNHQQVVTDTRYDLPLRYSLHAALSKVIIKLIAPSNPEHLLISSFFFPPLKHPETTTLVPPIIRPAVQALSPRRGDHVLVYYNQPTGAEHVLDTLRQVDASFILYNFPPPDRPEAYPNMTFKAPSLDGFLQDLAASRAVICTAGFTLISEALYLGKPLLVVPNRGIFEQTINALFLQRDRLGEAVLDGCLAPPHVNAFLGRLHRYEKQLKGRPAAGNKEAIACIEGVLSRIGPSVHTRPATQPTRHAASPLADAIAKTN